MPECFDAARAARIAATWADAAHQAPSLLLRQHVTQHCPEVGQALILDVDDGQKPGIP